MFVFKFKNKNILHLLAGCVHHKISNMRVKLIKYGVQFFFKLKKSKTVEFIAIKKSLPESFFFIDFLVYY